MPNVGDIAKKVRSKNAGPFWITIDIFCDSDDAYGRIVNGVSRDRIAALCKVAAEDIKLFEVPSLQVVKVSLPRPTIQGAIDDSDMHGAALGALIAEMDLN